MKSLVTEISPAASDRALQRFSKLLAYETDCWDVHNAISNQKIDFVLLDVRSPDLYMKGHIPTAINLPWRKIIASKLNVYASDTIFVTYCAGPHCNGALRGAIALAALSRPVKIMTGGITGWLDEGFSLET